MRGREEGGREGERSREGEGGRKKQPLLLLNYNAEILNLNLDISAQLAKHALLCITPSLQPLSRAGCLVVGWWGGYKSSRVTILTLLMMNICRMLIQGQRIDIMT